MEQSDYKSIFFTRSLLSRIIEQTWEDALNFKQYKNPYTCEEIRTNRRDALLWFASDEFLQWCGALGLDDEAILNELKKRYAMRKMQGRNESVLLSEREQQEVSEEEVFELRQQDDNEGGLCGEASCGVWSDEGSDEGIEEKACEERCKKK